MGIIQALKDYRESRRIEKAESDLVLLSDAMKAARGESPQMMHQHSASVAGAQQVFSSWQAWDAYLYGYGRSSIDYAGELGNVRFARMIQAAARWVSKNLNDARFQVVELDPDNKEKEIEDHPLSRLFKRPNPYYSGASLLRGFATDWIAYGEGNFIALINEMGEPVELWYEPFETIRPVSPADGIGQFITHYEILRNGKWIAIREDDPQTWFMRVFRVYDTLDPVTRRGTNGLQAAIKDIYTDEQASAFTARLLKRNWVPPVVVSVGDKDTPAPPVTSNEWAAMKEGFERRFGAGSSEALKPWLVNGPVKAERLGYDYSSTGMKEVRAISEAAFCSIVGIHAESLNFLVAGDRASWNNVREFRKSDYQDYIKPLHSLIADEATVQLLPMFGETNGRVRCQWDYSKVDLLQPDKDSEWKRAGDAFKNRGIDQAEYREAIGYKFDETHKGVYYPVPSNTITLSPIGEPPDAEVSEVPVKPNGAARPS